LVFPKYPAFTLSLARFAGAIAFKPLIAGQQSLQCLGTGLVKMDENYFGNQAGSASARCGLSPVKTSTV
jgi:glutamine amidotransferase PdxT